MLSEAPARHDLNGDIWPISICDIDHNTATKKYQRRDVDITSHDSNVHNKTYILFLFVILDPTTHGRGMVWKFTPKAHRAPTHVFLKCP